jgi:hypothetical protein
VAFAAIGAAGTMLGEGRLRFQMAGKKEIYTHVATNIVKGIEWPIDTLN